MNKREEINGTRTVETGRIIFQNLPTQLSVDKTLEFLKGDGFCTCTYEQSGVAGSYCIIERCGQKEESDYAN